jgi:hypothetical protein
MLPLNTSLIFLRTPKLFFSLGLIYFLLLSVLPVEAQTPSKQSPAEINIAAQKALAKTLSKNPWSNIKGFRTAKFGMDKKNVYRAIAKDFKIAKSNVKSDTSVKENTDSFEITVPKLFSTGGTAQIGYVFGHKSKKLAHVNIVWGVGEKGNAASIVETANLLRTHFMKKRYQENGLTVNGKLSENSTMVFRGRDKKGRMVLLLLNAREQTEKSDPGTEVNLVLSYIETPDNPDIRKIVIGDDEF